jgi:hypothetical protein
VAAGLPGFGLGGLFFLLSALIAPVGELVRTIRGQSSAGRWLQVCRQFAMALVMIVAIDATLRVMFAATSAAGGPGAPGASPASVITVLPLAPFAITAALLATVLTVVKMMELIARARRPSAPTAVGRVARAAFGGLRRLIAQRAET